MLVELRPPALPVGLVHKDLAEERLDLVRRNRQRELARRADRPNQLPGRCRNHNQKAVSLSQ